MGDIAGYFLPGILVTLVALRFKYRPPKEINWLYGYRTNLSMKNQDVWQEANRYAANMLLIAALSSLLLSLMLFLFVGGDKGMIISVAGMVLLIVILSFVPTERHLRRLFDKDGQRKMSRDQ